MGAIFLWQKLVSRHYSLDTSKRLEQSERFLESVIENLPNMLFVKDAKELRFIRFNRAGEELLGLPREQLLGRNDFDLFPKEQAEHFIKADRQVLEGSTAVDIADEPLTTSQGTRSLHTKKIPILGHNGKAEYLLGISEDITEKKISEKQRQAQADAENTANQLRFLAEATRTISESLDLQKTLEAFTQLLVIEFADWCELVLIREGEQSAEDVFIAHRNPKLKSIAEDLRSSRMTQWDPSEASGRVLREGASALITGIDDALIDSQVPHPARRASIKKLGVQSAIHAPIQAYGQVLGVLTVATLHGSRDFTKLEVALTQELGKRVAFALENARLFRKAQEANRAKSAFLANMSHEIRTPLGAMLGFADLLLGEKLNPEASKYVGTILKNGRQLLRIVDEILDLSKVESDQVSIEIIEFSLKDLINEVTGLLEVQARDKALEFRVLIPPQLPDRIVSDPNRLRQILINVIGNAIKFTAQGFVEVRVDVREHSAHPEEPVFEFRITDSGIGIDHDQAQKLFQPFTQADNSMTRRFGGTGLGLFVSRKLARLLGGDVVLSESGLSQGSQFLITLTAKISSATPLTFEIPESAPPVGHALPRPRILVVDDSPDNRTLIFHYLSRMGYSADVAGTGIEAIEKASHFDYAVVLMDVQMPEMDGLEAVRRLRQNNYRKPIIALTAHAMKGDREQCLVAGFDEYLHKPIDRERLRTTLEHFTEPR